MTRQSTRLVPALLLAALPLAPLFADKGPHGRPFAGGGPPMGEERMDRLAEHQAERLTRALNLTAEQQATLARLQDELETAVRPLAEEMRTAHERLRTLLDANSPDPATVGAQAIAIDHGRDAMHTARLKFEADIAASLTDAQRTTFRALQEIRPEGEHFGGAFGDRRGPSGRGEHPRH